MSVASVAPVGRGCEVLPPEAYAAVMLELPGLWQYQVGVLLGQRRQQPAKPGREPCDARGPQVAPAEAWALIRRGRAADVGGLFPRGRVDREVAAAVWASHASRLDVGARWATYRRAGVAVSLLGTPGYPDRLAGDERAPFVLFRQGRRLDLDGPTVAIVGTRRCSPAGRETALEWGAALAARGIRVVSGLALGIDGAAHQGALAAAGSEPIGVVAGGFDLPYPARHRPLWARVRDAGALVSEWPLGTPSEGWRFPSRNRIIAALADAVVVVESKAAGGSMITAEEALERGIAVLAVPGSIRNPVAAGTNRLIQDGAQPVCSVDDVLLRLSLEPIGRTVDLGPPPPTDPIVRSVLDAVGWEPTSPDAVLTRAALDPTTVSGALARLEIDGWVTGEAGWWQRRR